MNTNASPVIGKHINSWTTGDPEPLSVFVLKDSSHSDDLQLYLPQQDELSIEDAVGSPGSPFATMGIA